MGARPGAAVGASYSGVRTGADALGGEAPVCFTKTNYKMLFGALLDDRGRGTHRGRQR